MILSDHTRRWLEVQFYYFCLDIFHTRNNMLDVIYSIEAISQIGTINTKEIKLIAGKILGEPHYLPTQTELILLAYLHNVKPNKIADYINKSRQYIHQTVQNKLPNYAPYPLLDVHEDEIIKEFLDLLQIFKKAGI